MRVRRTRKHCVCVLVDSDLKGATVVCCLLAILVILTDEYVDW